MNRTRFRLLVLGVLAVGAVTLGALAVAVTEPDSTTEALIRDLHQTLLAVAIPLGVLVEAALFYAAIEFHGDHEPKPTKENRRLEIAWTVGVAVILLFVASSSYVVLAQPMVSTPPDATPQQDAVEVDVTGQNWFWTFTYPGENVTTKNELVLPADRTIFFRITARDVIHSVHVPGLGIKQDAIPGRTNKYRTHVTGTGNYTLYCAEYCGAGHSKMTASVRVVSQEEYRAWLRQQRRNAGSNVTTSTGTTTAGSSTSEAATTGTPTSEALGDQYSRARLLGAH